MLEKKYIFGYKKYIFGWQAGITIVAALSTKTMSKEDAWHTTGKVRVPCGIT
jgi:hypothetical protein